MGMTAENIAEKYVISRTAQDYFACESQEKAQAAIKSGRFDDEIEPLPVKKKKEILMFAADEHPRLSTIEKLAELKPAFKKDGSVTAGNASGRNDGGAMLLIKLALLLGIKAIWFDQPTLPENGTERLDSHLFSRPATPSSPLAEETPR